MAVRGKLDLDLLEARIPDELLVEICERFFEKLAQRFQLAERFANDVSSDVPSARLVAAIRTLRLTPKIHAICSDLVYKQKVFFFAIREFDILSLPRLEREHMMLNQGPNILQNLTKACIRVHLFSNSVALEELLKFLLSPMATLPRIQQVMVDMNVPYTPDQPSMQEHKELVLKTVKAVKAAPIKKRYVGGSLEHDWICDREAYPPILSKGASVMSIQEVVNAVIGDMETCNGLEHLEIDCKAHNQ